MNTNKTILLCLFMSANMHATTAFLDTLIDQMRIIHNQCAQITDDESKIHLLKKINQLRLTYYYSAQYHSQTHEEFQALLEVLN